MNFYLFIIIFLSAICPDLYASQKIKQTDDEKKKFRKFDRPQRKQEKSEKITAAKKEVGELYRVHEQLRRNLLVEASKLEDKELVEDIQGFVKGLQTILDIALSDVVNESAMKKLEEEKKTLKQLNEELLKETHKVLELEQIESGRILP